MNQSSFRCKIIEVRKKRVGELSWMQVVEPQSPKKSDQLEHVNCPFLCLVAYITIFDNQRLLESLQINEDGLIIGSISYCGDMYLCQFG